MTIGTFQCSVSMRVSFVLRSAEETLEMIMHFVACKHRNGTKAYRTCYKYIINVNNMAMVNNMLMVIKDQ